MASSVAAILSLVTLRRVLIAPSTAQRKAAPRRAMQRRTICSATATATQSS